MSPRVYTCPPPAVRELSLLGPVASVGARDSEVLEIDVSEFHKKGGGSVKCMIGDMGEIGGGSES